MKDLDAALASGEKERQLIKARVAQAKAELARAEQDYQNTKLDLAPYLVEIQKLINAATEEMREALNALAFDETKGSLNPLHLAQATQVLPLVSEFTSLDWLLGKKGGDHLFLLMAVDAFERKNLVFKALNEIKYPILKRLCVHFGLCEDVITKASELFDKQRELQRKSFIMPLDMAEIRPLTEQDLIKLNPNRFVSNEFVPSV